MRKGGLAAHLQGRAGDLAAAGRARCDRLRNGGCGGMTETTAVVWRWLRRPARRPRWARPAATTGAERDGTVSAHRSAALRQPRAVVARLQRSRPPARRGRVAAADRAASSSSRSSSPTSTSSSWSASPASTTRSTPGSTPADPTGCRPTAGARGDRRAGARAQDRRHARQFTDVVRPELAEHGIRIVSCEESGAPRAEIERHFREQIFPVLTPLAIGPGRPVPVHLEPVAEPDRPPPRPRPRPRGRSPA